MNVWSTIKATTSPLFSSEKIISSTYLQNWVNVSVVAAMNFALRLQIYKNSGFKSLSHAFRDVKGTMSAVVSVVKSETMSKK